MSKQGHTWLRCELCDISFKHMDCSVVQIAWLMSWQESVIDVELLPHEPASTLSGCGETWSNALSRARLSKWWLWLWLSVAVPLSESNSAWSLRQVDWRTAWFVTITCEQSCNSLGEPSSIYFVVVTQSNKLLFVSRLRRVFAGGSGKTPNMDKVKIDKYD